MAKIIGANIPDIPWEDKPAGFEYPVWRYSGNPVITRDNLHMANSIFNSAVVSFGSGFAGVFRADIRSRAQKLVVGFSDDAVNLRRLRPAPVRNRREILSVLGQSDPSRHNYRHSLYGGL